jgi:hypothetical protein
VITAVPKELSLGLTKCTRVKDRPFQVQARLEEAHRDRTSFAELVNAPWQGTRRQWPAMSSIIHTKSDSKTEIRVFLTLTDKTRRAFRGKDSGRRRPPTCLKIDPHSPQGKLLGEANSPVHWSVY